MRGSSREPTHRTNWALKVDCCAGGTSSSSDLPTRSPGSCPNTVVTAAAACRISPLGATESANSPTLSSTSPARSSGGRGENWLGAARRRRRLRVALLAGPPVGARVGRGMLATAGSSKPTPRASRPCPSTVCRAEVSRSIALAEIVALNNTSTTAVARDLEAPAGGSGSGASRSRRTSPSTCGESAPDSRASSSSASVSSASPRSPGPGTVSLSLNRPSWNES